MARDNIDGDITSKVKISVNDGNERKRIFTYTVSDKAGNTQIINRTYEIVDVEILDEIEVIVGIN